MHISWTSTWMDGVFFSSGPRAAALTGTRLGCAALGFMLVFVGAAALWGQGQRRLMEEDIECLGWEVLDEGCMDRGSHAREGTKGGRRNEEWGQTGDSPGR